MEEMSHTGAKKAPDHCAWYSSQKSKIHSADYA